MTVRSQSVNDEPALTFNLEVADWNSYFVSGSVGQAPVWVHNASLSQPSLSQPLHAETADAVRRWRHTVSEIAAGAKLPIAARRLSDIQEVTGGRVIHIEPGAVLVMPEKGPPQLWVDPRKRTYRKIWKRVFGEMIPKFDIDHTYSKARAVQTGMRWVRLEEIPKGGNQAAGRTHEKAIARGGRSKTLKPRRPSDIRFADEFQKYKLVGVRYEGRRRWRRPPPVPEGQPVPVWRKVNGRHLCKGSFAEWGS